MKRIGLSLNQQLIAGTAVMLTLTLLLSGGLIFEISSGYVAADRTVKAMSLIRQALVAAYYISIERGKAQGLLTEPGLTDRQLRDRLGEARAATDRALDATIAAAQAIRSDFGETAAEGGMTRLRARLGLARMECDSLASERPGDRAPERIAVYNADMFDAYDTVKSLVDETIVNLSVIDPALAQPAMVALMLSELREQAGRASSYVFLAAQSHRSLSAEGGTQLLRTFARIEELWRVVSSQAERYRDTPDVAQARFDVQVRFFMLGLPSLRDAVNQLNDDPWAAPSVADLRVRYLSTVESVERLGMAFVDLTQKLPERERDTAFRRLIVVSVATGLAVLLNVMLILGARNLVLLPLLRVREHIIGLAETGEAQIEPSRGPSEMRRLFEALAALTDRVRERRRHAEALKIQAETDGLTGLANRLTFDRIGAGDPAFAALPGDVGLIMIDLDHFKAVNDRYGHLTGDRVLKHVSHVILGRLRHGDVAARYGGEEIAVVVMDGPGRHVADLAEALRQAICDAPVELDDGTHLAVTASLGVGGGPRGGSEWALVVDAADEALYRAKALGRNRVVEAAGRPHGMLGPAMVA